MVSFAWSSAAMKMESITVTVELQPSQVEFAKSLLDSVPGTWELHCERLVASLAISQLNYLMYLKLADSDPAAVDESRLLAPQAVPDPGPKGSGLRPGENEETGFPGGPGKAR
jgi:hypothetical protein